MLILQVIVDEEPEIITGRPINTNAAINYQTKPTVIKSEIMTLPPTVATYRPTHSVIKQNSYSYDLSPSPEDVKTMPFTTPQTMKPTKPSVENNESEDDSIHETTVFSTNNPSTQVTDPMKKFTYAVRTTAPPAYLIRNELPETPSSYYQYSDSRTGLPQVKSLPPLGAQYRYPISHEKVLYLWFGVESEKVK